MITLIDYHAGTKGENLVPQKLDQRTEIHLRTFEQCPCSRLRAHSENRQAKEPLHFLCWDCVGHGWGQGWFYTRKGRVSRLRLQSIWRSWVRCEGFHTTESIHPSFPLAYLTCSSHFQEALGRSVQMRCRCTSHQASVDLTSSKWGLALRSADGTERSITIGGRQG